MLKDSTLIYIAITILVFILLMLFIMYFTRETRDMRKIGKNEDDIDNFEIYAKLEDLSNNVKKLENKIKAE